MITGKEMEKLKIIPPDAQIYAQVKASWDKIAKPLDGLGQFETMFAQIGAIIGSKGLQRGYGKTWTWSMCIQLCKEGVLNKKVIDCVYHLLEIGYPFLNFINCYLITL